VIPPPPQTAVASVASEQARRHQLAVTKWQATVLLGAVTAVFAAATLSGSSASWVDYVQATAAASMVGGLADWFAVTALFRRPLGLPIPHTAIVVERKDSFARTLGEFIQHTFLTPELLVARIRAAGVVERAASWLCDPANASRAAAELAQAIVAVTDLLRDEDVQRTIEGALRQAVAAVPAAPAAGTALRFLTRDGRGDQLLDQALGLAERYLRQHRDELRRALGRKSRWWVPGAVEERLFDRVLDGVASVLADMAANHDHELRRQFNARVATLADDLETSPELRERGQQLTRDLLAQPEVETWVAALWADLKHALEAQAANPASVLRQRLAEGLVGIGQRLLQDRTLAAKVEAAVESAVGYVAEHFNGAIAGLVTHTVARWDAEETASRLELLLGPDLQYVRINGTVFGAGAGLLLHVVARTLH
jgi:uncharacterized membrane-anchored protein YjiN (DUF445 family)